MDECFFEFKAVDVITKNNLWLFQLKNIGVILLLFLPIIFAKTFNLTNKFYVFGVISMFVIIVFALFFKIGYDTTLSFYLDKIRISKNNLKNKTDMIFTNIVKVNISSNMISISP
jgi:hypothetical protein